MVGLQKSMKSHKRSEHSIMSSVAFMLAGAQSTFTLAQKIGGATLKPIEAADWS